MEQQLPRQQGLFDETFYPLARLLEVNHPQLDAVGERIRKRKAEQQARRAAFERGEWFQDTLNLAWRCVECGEVNEYRVRQIAVNPAEPGSHPLLAHEFACASCGAWADFEFTTEAKLAVTAELIKLAADSDVAITVGEVASPTDLTETIIEDVLLDEPSREVENSYLANLKKVVEMIEKGRVTPALNQLDAFIHKVETDINHGSITPTQGDLYILMAQDVIDLLTGPEAGWRIDS